MNMRLKRCLVFVLSELLRIKFSCSWADADTLVYHAGATAIVHNITRNRQQHYTAHSVTSQLWLSASNLAWPPQGSAERSLAFKSGASTHASPYLLLHLRPFSVASLPSVGVVLDLALSLWGVTTIARRSYFLSRAAPALLRCTRRTYRDLPAKTPLKTSTSSRL